MVQYRDLDPVLHSQLRLAVVSLLTGTEAAGFTLIRQQTGATSGNLSVQITKLREAGYIEVTKKFTNNYPQTLCRLTPMGRRKFAEYVTAIKDYLDPLNNG